LALDERLALLVVGFDLWLERNKDGEVKLIPMPTIDKGECTVDNVEDAAQAARTLRSEFTDSKFAASGKSIKMTGSADSLLQARRWLVNHQQPELGKSAGHVFSIETTASRGGILASVARQINCQLIYPPSAKQELLEMVTIKMAQQPVDAIIAAVLEGTQLKYQIEGSQLVIKP